MKKVIYFIVLKVLEISGIVFIPYFIGMGLQNWDWYYLSICRTPEPLWLTGFMGIILTAALLGILLLIIVILCANWQWATKLSNRKG
jgi:hypothetical protein